MTLPEIPPVCGAKTRAGTPCKLPPMPNGRCYRHGGATPSGVASPHFKHGRYSKDLPTRLVSSYEAVKEDHRLLGLREELALVDALICDVLGRIGEHHEGTVAKREVVTLIDLRRRLCESERKRLVEARQMISTEEGMVLVAALTDAVMRHVKDPAALAAIGAEIRRLIGTNN